MATNDYNELLNQLSDLNQVPCLSEGQKFQVCIRALELVKASNLPEDEQKKLSRAIDDLANPSGFRYISTGIKAALELLEELRAVEAKPAPSTGFNLVNLSKLVSDGQIFSVTFTKRSTGELRKMRCRLGVKKHLSGGSKSYDPAKSNLLTVFDMDKAGYRSIPIDGIQRLSVSGQTFSFGEVGL